MRALLDVNVLIALHDQTHQHHRQAVHWLALNQALGWASCPLTQNGALRIMSQPSYTQLRSLAVVIQSLQKSVETPNHQLWPDDISLLDLRIPVSAVQGANEQHLVIL